MICIRNSFLKLLWHDMVGQSSVEKCSLISGKIRRGEKIIRKRRESTVNQAKALVVGQPVTGG